MANVIVVAVVIVLLGFALKGTLKHLKGESPCCGGGDTIIIEDKKLDGPVIGKKTVNISGMHCDHCVRAVTEAINKIDGASAKVNLKKKEAVVSYEKVVEDAAIFCSAAVFFRISCNFRSYTCVMSGNRTPNSSKFCPIRGLGANREM